MKFKERRTMTGHDLWNLCNKKNWYTAGTNDEYSEMFELLVDNCLSAEMTTDLLYEIAANIFAHSDEKDCSDGYLSIPDIMYDLCKICSTVFIEQ
jgi:hypothetical protein